MSAPITNIPFSNPLYRNHNFYRRYGKRALDFTGALFGLICLFPVLAILAILLAIVQRTSPFFLQKRIGHGLKPFHIIKFKTMKDTRDKEGNLLPDEERTTVLGSLLRSTSLDELPELINVLLGDMSFIGPRPWIPDQMAIFTPSTRKKRMSLRPGITGLAQIRGRNNLTFRQRVCYDPELPTPPDLPVRPEYPFLHLPQGCRERRYSAASGCPEYTGPCTEAQRFDDLRIERKYATHFKKYPKRTCPLLERTRPSLDPQRLAYQRSQGKYPAYHEEPSEKHPINFLHSPPPKMKISVITVCYNSIATLQDTLESILRQTYPDVESIVVDGASKDGTVELIEKYSHQFSGRMKWLSEPDKGIYDAMNKGIGMATGDVIGFLNADDYYQDENVLKAIARAFAWHGTDAVHGNLHYINGVRDTVRTWRGTEYSPGSFQRGWSPAHPTFYCKKGCFIRYGGFDPSIGSAADFELMLRFIEKNHISTAYIDRDMVFMRTGGSSTAGLRAILRNTRQNKQAFRKNNLPYPWHYGVTRLLAKAGSTRNPIHYLFKTR